MILLLLQPGVRVLNLECAPVEGLRSTVLGFTRLSLWNLVCPGLALCREYNRGRGRAKGKRTQHRTQAAAVCGWKWISCKREALEKLGIRRDQLWGVYAGFPYS